MSEVPLSREMLMLPISFSDEECERPVGGILEGRCKATEKREIELPWREAGPPNHLDDKVDSDQVDGAGCEDPRPHAWSKCAS